MVLFTVPFQLTNYKTSGSTTVVQNWPHHPKVKGSCPVVTADTRRDIKKEDLMLVLKTFCATLVDGLIYCTISTNHLQDQW